MNIKSEKICILAKSGGGKDFLMRELIKKGLKPCLKWTTRPARKFEKQGITYNFVTKEHFIENIESNNFLAYQKFTVTPDNQEPEDWYYGITIDEFKLSQVFIMTPGELNSLNEEQKKKCFVVYLDIDRSIRESRLHHREDKNDSIKRRLDSDEIDFRELTYYDLRITDPEFTVDDIYDLMD